MEYLNSSEAVYIPLTFVKRMLMILLLLEVSPFRTNLLYWYAGNSSGTSGQDESFWISSRAFFIYWNHTSFTNSKPFRFELTLKTGNPNIPRISPPPTWNSHAERNISGREFDFIKLFTRSLFRHSSFYMSLNIITVFSSICSAHPPVCEPCLRRLIHIQISSGVFKRIFSRVQRESLIAVDI